MGLQEVEAWAELIWFWTGRVGGGARKVHEGPEEILYCFFNIGAKWGGWSTSHPGRVTPGKDPVPTVQEAGWATKSGLDGCGKSRPHRYSIPGPSSP
jgi:hypothetical protein